ncbi:restriction endonuclease [Proteiniborus sp. MB09-C3]|uniref:restriction endonuclease n=1 Tax=Proteiniborus sp. MB09-C3 TaxID=3050072 RepID=UPI0027A85288|nr:restriction endonuclease [Proteiniborus sp. MB09-C3]
MQGRADKGLFITTRSFTRDAVKEATRDGASLIDLIDGEQLIDMLKELELGVREIIRKDYEVDKTWYEKIWVIHNCSELSSYNMVFAQECTGAQS